MRYRGLVAAGLIALSTLAAGAREGGKVAADSPRDCGDRRSIDADALVEELPIGKDHPAMHRLLPSDSSGRADGSKESSLSYGRGAFRVMYRGHGPGEQLVGVIESRQELEDHEFFVSIECGERAHLLAELDGSISVFSGPEQIGSIAVPWAFDALGQPLKTGFSVAKDSFSQWIEMTGATFPIVIDPTYSSLNCNAMGRYSNMGAVQYLDMLSPSSDYGFCAPEPLHVLRNSYQAVWAFEQNVANDYGWVLTRQAGECGYIADTGGWWDFQVPCKAHDYCYDLRKAGLSGTVTDANCDDEFYNLMLANCNDRSVVSRGLCNTQALTMRQFVGPAVTDADPALLSLLPLHVFQSPLPNVCADVFGGSVAAGADIVQWPCTYGSNQRFRFIPASGYPGEFYIINQQSAKCIQSVGSQGLLEQFDCFPFNSAQRWILQGSFNQNIYTVRQSSVPTKCWDIPSSSSSHGVQISTFTCNETANQRWVML